MAWYSILPDHLTFYETLIIRIFLFLGLLNISPWLIAITYDLIYYIARQTWHEVPVYGGRARGEARPRAPSLRDRVRRRSIAAMISGDTPASTREESKTESVRKRQHQHQRALSHDSIPEEELET